MDVVNANLLYNLVMNPLKESLLRHLAVGRAAPDSTGGYGHA